MAFCCGGVRSIEHYCPKGCGAWDVEGFATNGMWHPENEEDLVCPECGCEMEATW